MKLTVLGANGRTGRLVIKAALDRRIDVTAVVRSADKQPDMAHNRLSVEIGNPCDPAFLKEVFREQDVVISTLGGRRPTKAAAAIYDVSARAIVTAAHEVGLKRVLVTSTALLFPARTFWEKTLQFLVPHVVRSAARMEEILAASNLDWTAARCGFLNDAQVKTYRAESGKCPDHGSSVSRLALAHFLLDAIDKPDTHRGVLGVSKERR